MVNLCQFRLFVALLAAFGGFFAYVCRLNLSLVIFEMTTIRHDDAADAQALGELVNGSLDEPNNHTNEAPIDLKNSRFEEQTLAELASARPWWIRKEPSKQKMPIMRRNQLDKESLRQKTMRMLQGNSVEMLSIDFDARPILGAGQPESERESHVSVESVLNPLPKLDWSMAQRNQILGAFFLGYVIFQIPAARAAEMFGAKTLLLLAGFGTGLTSILFVLAARLFQDSFWCAYLIRLLMGASQAGLFPAIYVLLCEWLPQSERSYWLPVPSAMGRSGTIAMNFFAPLVVRHYGWPMVFMVSGGVTLAWSLVFLVLVSSTPATSRWLSRAELLHIQSAASDSRLAATSLPDDSRQADSSAPNKPSDSIDWLKVVTNGPIAILTVAMFASDWSNMLLLVLLPSFLGLALDMEVEQIGTCTICLVTVYCFGYPLSGALASKLEQRRCLSSLAVRKLFETVAVCLQAAGCLLIGFYGSKPLILFALFLIMLGRSTVGGGQCLMPPELSKQYPGTVMAYANALSSLASFFGPQIVSWLVDEPTQRESWRNLWLISSGLFLLCGLLFLVLADNAPQELARAPRKPKPNSQLQLSLPPYLPPGYATSAPHSDQSDPSAAGAVGRPLARGRLFERHTRTQARMSAFSSVSSEPSQSQASQFEARRSPPPLVRRI